MSRFPGKDDLNQSLERAGRVADFLEFAELMIIDALARQESCGGHFNEKPIKRLKTKPCATTKNSAMWPPGSIKGAIRRLRFTRSR
jgi:succinate dehydrogenase/fumarate reductase flavoprotein subunit